MRAFSGLLNFIRM